MAGENLDELIKKLNRLRVLSEKLRSEVDDVRKGAMALQDALTVLVLSFIDAVSSSVKSLREINPNYDPGINKEVFEYWRKVLVYYLSSDTNNQLMEKLPYPTKIVEAYRFLESCYQEKAAKEGGTISN